MEAKRMALLMLLWCRIRSTRVALVGGNHTASRSPIEILGNLYMESACGCRPKNEIKLKRTRNASIGLNSNALLIIKLPDLNALRVFSRSLFLAMLVLALPCIGPILRGPSSSSYFSDSIGSYSMDFDLLPLLFHDLSDEGLLEKGHRALILSSGVDKFTSYSEFLNENEINLIIEYDLVSKSSIPDEGFDFVLALNSESAKFADRVLKTGGLLVLQLSNDPPNAIEKLPNYRIVYLRRFDSTVVAMRKTGLSDESVNTPQKLQCGSSNEEAKKAALKGLEDVLLEPPAKSSHDLKKIKFLPDLLGDSLESYEKRIFITDENGGAQWFYQNYPKKNQYFEVNNLEIEVYETGMSWVSGWLRKNVREDDFVVMKAEAQVVEEMMRERTLCLVDELFLECKNQWQGDGKRAYWECLALYGKLKDEGVAVHQWWR